MVEYTLNLDLVFGSLADPTRRDILRRVSKRRLSVGQIAKHYDLTFAAVAKHLKVLETARLIIKSRKGKEQIVQIYPKAFVSVAHYLSFYKDLRAQQHDALDELLSKQKGKYGKN